MDQRYFLELRERLRTQRGKQALAILHQLERGDDLPEQIYTLIQKARDFLWQLQQASEEQTIQFVQRSQYTDQYAAVPILAFLVPEVFEAHFTAEQDNQDPLPFRLILAQLLRTWYPAESMLPIGADYKAYPFLIFRSYNMSEIQHRLFSGNSVFASYEMNVLNMLLSTQADDDKKGGEEK